MPQNNEKLLALAKSDTPHEAALALQRAQKLMQAYNITQADLALSDIDESVRALLQSLIFAKNQTLRPQPVVVSESDFTKCAR